MVEGLRGAGCTVLTATLPDLTHVTSVAALWRARIARVNAEVRRVAHTHGVLVADLVGPRATAARRAWRTAVTAPPFIWRRLARRRFITSQPAKQPVALPVA